VIDRKLLSLVSRQRIIGDCPLRMSSVPGLSKQPRSPATFKFRSMTVLVTSAASLFVIPNRHQRGIHNVCPIHIGCGIWK
jgi:hypothetical protein